MTRRIHWFWRGLLAVVVPIAYEIFIYAGKVPWSDAVIPFIYESLGGTYRYKLDWQLRVAYAITYHLPAILLAVSIYAILTRLSGPRAAGDGETRCRKCGYILKGLTEPRCSECGERI